MSEKLTVITKPGMPECGCSVLTGALDTTIIFCPLHAHAEELLQALLSAESWLDIKECPIVIKQQIANAIAKSTTKGQS